jgi:hypothetical protein
MDQVIHMEIHQRIQSATADLNISDTLGAGQVNSWQPFSGV